MKTFKHVRPPPRATKYPYLGNMWNFHTAVIRNEIRTMWSPCSLCQSLDHGVWFCRQFHNKRVDDHCQFAKERKLCFWCLATDHRGKDCRKACIYGIEGCPQNHHRLLHGLETLSETGPMTMLPCFDEERRPVIPWEGVLVVTMTSCNAKGLIKSYSVNVWINCQCVHKDKCYPR